MEEETAEKKKALKVDPAWEFIAPKYYDFCVGETEADRVAAEVWFVTANSYAASPHVGKSKPVAELLNLETNDDMEEVSDCVSPNQNKENQSDVRVISFTTPPGKVTVSPNSEVKEDTPCEVKDVHIASPAADAPASKIDEDVSLRTPKPGQDEGVQNTDRKPFSVMPSIPSSPGSLPVKRLHSQNWKEVNVPGPATMPKLQRPSTAHPHLCKKKETKRVSPQAAKTVVSPEDPANKKQKLEGGRLRQIKDRLVRPNDAPPALTRPQEFKFCTEQRSRLHVVRSTAQAGKAMSPFVSMAERVRSFQLKTPERFHVHPTVHHETDEHEKRRMKLTQPKTPDLETSHRIRPARIKSTAELEEEMLAKIPKFKARPAPKKDLGGTSPPLPKPAPHVPEFQEFHFRTMERALQHQGTAAEQHDQSSMTKSTDSQSVDELKQRRKSAPDSNNGNEPRVPRLLTAQRVRPITVKSREELELEELAKVPKFKARPLNKRILESRGELGVFRVDKKQPTKPQEFHFATDERLQQKEHCLEEQFGKMSLHQLQTPSKETLRPTIPEPFNLETENRGLVKEMKFLQELVAREQEEQQARVPRAHPLPFTTDVPAIPPKPEPKHCTRPEPFQLESLVRHEDELQRIAEDRKRAYDLEAALKLFRAHPNLSSAGCVFVPSRSRKPLTEVHEFTFHLDTRAVERADFNERVNEKQNQYKRFRDEYEAARKLEEERTIKAMRREMIPHARPMPVYSKPFIPQRSTKELTRPVSPQFNLLQSRRPSSERRRLSSTSTASLRRRTGHMR